MFAINYLMINVCSHPAPGLLCHGPLIGISYRYSYKCELIMNNNDLREPTGFGVDSQITVENVWQNSDSYLLSLVIDWTQFKSRSGAKFGDGLKINDWNHPLFAHIDSSGRIEKVFIHQSECITATNLKKSLLEHLRSKKPEESSYEWIKTGQSITKKSLTTNSDFKSITSPDVFDEWQVSAQLASDHPIVNSANGWQNVSLQSRIYSYAHSLLHNSFSLKLLSEEKSSTEKLIGNSLSEVLKKLEKNYIPSESSLTPEVKTCHNCQSLSNLIKENETSLKRESIASIPMTISYLKLIDRVRSSGAGALKEDILKLFKSYKNKREIILSLLDIIAGSRNEQSLSAALEFLNLPKSDDLEFGERFLIHLAASVMSASKMEKISCYTLSSGEILNNIFVQTLTPKWKSEKLKHTALLIVGTLLRAHLNSKDTNFEESNDIVTKILKHLTNELDSCEETECRVVLLHAIGNSGVVKHGVYQSIKKYALSGKRESIAAMKALKECLEVSGSDDKLNIRLRHLLLRVVYDHERETTSRLIAAELISKYLNDEKTTRELIKHLPSFGNNELATIIWNRALASNPTITYPHNNWFLHSTTFNGSSAAFKRTMGGTKTMNASYHMFMELLNKGKLLKESSFDVELSSPEGYSQHLLTVEIFARGLQSFAGDSDGSSDTAEDESTMAGMSLRLMNVQLRPFVFFTGTGELMGHVWSGTASEPTNAFEGNLLLSDYWSTHSLINGLVVEQQLKGVLSLDLSGEIQISLWNRNSHSVVSTKGSLLFQGSQTVLTSDRSTSASKQFSFGGTAQLNFITDLDFYSSPFKMCMQVIQPQFTFRHNTRKHEQINSENLHKRIHRRLYTIPAKSYALHRDNNNMCSAMNIE